MPHYLPDKSAHSYSWGIKTFLIQDFLTFAASGTSCGYIPIHHAALYFMPLQFCLPCLWVNSWSLQTVVTNLSLFSYADFKICPQILWYSIVWKMRFNSLPLRVELCDFFSNKETKVDVCVTPRLGHKRHLEFSCILYWITLREASYYFLGHSGSLYRSLCAKEIKSNRQ